MQALWRRLAADHAALVGWVDRVDVRVASLSPEAVALLQHLERDTRMRRRRSLRSRRPTDSSASATRMRRWEKATATCQTLCRSICIVAQHRGTKTDTETVETGDTSTRCSLPCQPYGTWTRSVPVDLHLVCFVCCAGCSSCNESARLALRYCTVHSSPLGPLGSTGWPSGPSSISGLNCFMISAGGCQLHSRQVKQVRHVKHVKRAEYMSRSQAGRCV